MSHRLKKKLFRTVCLSISIYSFYLFFCCFLFFQILYRMYAYLLSSYVLFLFFFFFYLNHFLKNDSMIISHRKLQLVKIELDLLKISHINKMKNIYISPYSVLFFFRLVEIKMVLIISSGLSMEFLNFGKNHTTPLMNVHVCSR